MQLCFSYRGNLPARLRTVTLVTTLDGRISQNIYLMLSPEEFPPSPDSWTRRCINMLEFFMTSNRSADTGIVFETNRLIFENFPDDDFWIDEVSVQQGSNQSKFKCTNIRRSLWALLIKKIITKTVVAN